MSPELEGLTIIQQDDHQVFREGAPGRRNLAVEDSKLPIELNLPQEVPKGQEEVGGKKEGGGDLCARARRAIQETDVCYSRTGSITEAMELVAVVCVCVLCQKRWRTQCALFTHAHRRTRWWLMSSPLLPLFQELH
ncbi:unnamed protein product [Sphagnum jensenii]|uniref:Uncharacterized protein n=1 Tax=Sphagnum jensenii TaxID=128206 RepID=A0ABP0W4K4_9BRYO